MKKDQFERLIEAQRKNLKFSETEEQVDYGKFVLNFDRNEAKPAVPVELPKKPVQVVVSSAPRRNDYVDIRKLKMERKKSQEEAKKEEEKPKVTPLVQPAPTRPVGSVPFGFNVPSAPAKPAVPPAPERVLKGAKRTTKKKIDADLVEKKTHATYFDDLRS